MAVRSKQLAIGSVGSNADTPLYTVPSGYVTIVKNITVDSAQAAAEEVVLTVKAGTVSLTRFGIWAAAFGTSGASPSLDTWLVLEAGQTLHVQFGTSGGWYIVSGAELLL